MNDAFAKIYERRNSGFDFFKLMKTFRSRGISLENPRTGIVTGWSEEADDFRTSAAEISAKISSGNKAIFNWWLDSTQDVFCWIQPADVHLVEYYAICPEEWGKRRVVVSALLDHFATLCGASLGMALVLDLRRYPEMISEWDAFVLGQGEITSVQVLPDLLIVESQAADRVKIDLDGRSKEFCGKYIMITRETSPPQDLSRLINLHLRSP